MHWISALLLFIQIPIGFYLVDLDFGTERIALEDIHVTMGLSIFYLVILRLLYKIFNPTPKLGPRVFTGQIFLAKPKSCVVVCDNSIDHNFRNFKKII